MKREHIPWLLALLLSGIVIAIAATPPKIRWELRFYPNGLFAKDDGRVIQVGFRSDGLMVWREITTTTNKVSVTNSPSELETAQ